jgi:tetratricopeptide (TPR) repeat protein
MIRSMLSFLACALAIMPLAAQQGSAPRDQAAQNRAGITSSPQYSLLTDPVIQAELKLTDEQKAKLAKLPDELLAKNKDAIDKQEAELKAASEKRAAEDAAFAKQFDALLAKHLTAEQQRRLGQIAVQAQPTTLFIRNDEVGKRLGLTQTDLARFTEMQAPNREKLTKEFGNTIPPAMDPPTRQKYQTAMAKLQTEVMEKFVGTFTDAQKKAWAEMAGEPSAAAVAIRSSGTPRPSAGRFFSPAAMNFWRIAVVGNEKVLDELKVEKDARAALAAGLKAMQEDGVGGGGPGGGIGGPATIGRLRFTLSNEVAAQARELLTAPQAKRLTEIQFQLGGTSSLVGPAVGFQTKDNLLELLTFTPAQAAKIDAVLTDAMAETQKLGSPFQFANIPGRVETPEQEMARKEYQKKSVEIERKAMADILATFDAGQKGLWKEKTGEPFDTTKVTAAMAVRPTFTGRGRTVAAVLTQIAQSRASAGEYAAALAGYDAVLRLAPGSTSVIQQKASLLSSCPSEWVRDGKQAMELMQKLMTETKEPTPAQYLVLAAAFAETGQFDEAVKTQEKAIAALGSAPLSDSPSGFNPADRLKPSYEERLKLYQEKKPYRMPEPKDRGGMRPGGQ